ncbi:MAG: J domain-containing protein [Planctomycetes bacterium]|nr:J domain-containing protein [Planctomycetota bacterium]
MEEDYYRILGTRRDASQAEIQRAYRDMARKYHPDMNPDDAKAKEKFQRIQRAFDVLNDPEKREMYDRYGSSFDSTAAGGRPGGGWQGFQAGGAGGGFEDIDFAQMFGGRGADAFADIFRQFTGGRAQGGRGQGGRGQGGRGQGGRGQARQSERGTDLQHEIEVPFRTAISGGEASLAIQRPDGNVEHISVKIPPGIEDGQKVRVRGKGGPSRRDGTPGDIVLKVRVAAHPNFRRRGNHLEVTVPVTLAEAALGAKIDLPTPKGTITLTVPPGTSSGRRLRVKGLGVQPRKGAQGDLYAEVQIVLPAHLDDEALDHIRQIGHRHPLNPRTDLRW